MTQNSEAKDTCNGANVVIWTPNEEILMVRHAYNSRIWALPGGAIKQGETALEGAKREIKEETGLVLGNHLRHVALLAQKIKIDGVIIDGLLSLYSTQHYEGEITEDATGEISDARFMSLPEIFCSQHFVGLGYKRMIAIWKKQMHTLGLYERALKDPVSIYLGGQVLSI